MLIKRLCWIIAAAAVVCVAGCKKSGSTPGPTEAASTNAVPAAAPVAPSNPQSWGRVRFIGKKRVMTESNFVSVARIWSLPESLSLEKHLANSLAAWPLRWGGAEIDQPADTNHVAPLAFIAEHLLQEESVVQWRRSADGEAQGLIAVRLPAERITAWSNAITQVLQGANSNHVAAGNSGWTLTHSNSLVVLQLRRAGDWDCILFGSATNGGMDLSGEIQSLEKLAASNLFTLDLDLGAVAHAVHLPPAFQPAGRISLIASGDGTDVRAVGHIDLENALGSLPAWNVPTNLIHEPLSSFTAVRGVASWLAPLWKSWGAGEPPNQAFIWSQSQFPFFSYFAAPVADATNSIRTIRSFLIEHGTPWMETNGAGHFESSTNSEGIAWRGLQIMEPYAEVADHNFIIGGWTASNLTNRPPPAELLSQLDLLTNVAFYDWEVTSSRLEPLLYLDQLLRLALRTAQVPPPSPSIVWLRALEGPLGNAATVVTAENPRRLNVVRKGTIGLNSLEIHALIDWFESPTFPAGLNTFVGQPDRPRGKMQRRKAEHTNSVSHSNSAPLAPSAQTNTTTNLVHPPSGTNHVNAAPPVSGPATNAAH